MTDLQLDTLEARGLIRIATYEPELEYLFRHALLQDTAYESLLKQERRALHDVVGQTLEQLYPDRIGELAAVLAMHYEQAGETGKAIEYLTAAAAFAVERNALVEGVELYERAAALLPPASESDSDDVIGRRARLALGRARAAIAVKPEEEIVAILDPALADAKTLHDLRLEVDILLILAVIKQLHGESPETNAELRTALARVSEIADELGDPLIAAVPESLVGLHKVATGYLREGVELLERSAPLLEQKHDFVGSSFGLMFLSMGYARLGDFAKAHAAIERARQVAESGDVIARLDVMIGMANIRAIEGDLQAAVPIAEDCTRMAEESGAVACVVASNYALGDALMRQGKYLDAKAVLERSRSVASAINETSFRPMLSAYLRTNAVYLGQPSDDLDTFEEALAEATEHSDRWSMALVTWKRAEAEGRRDVTQRDAPQMLSDYAAAARLFEEMGARPYRARVLREWGDALFELGRGDEASEPLTEALALFREIGLDREATEVESTLASA